MPDIDTLRAFAQRLLPFLVAAAALAVIDHDDGGPPALLDLGGGITMTAEGEILGATPPSPVSSLDQVDFLFAPESQWRSLALEMQVGPTTVARTPDR